MIDFLIIGGGVAGVSAAYRLSALGQVTLLEREDALATHASGRSAAMFEENYGNPGVRALNTASFAYHKDADGGVLLPRGFMLLGTADNEAAFAADAQDMAVDHISVEDACARVPILNPDVITHAGIDTNAYDIDTDLLIQNFARKARENGAVLVVKSGVTAIERLPNGWAVTTSSETYEARHVVNAAGAWADEIATLAGLPRIGLTPYRRSMARIPAPGGHDVANWPMIFGPGETWYAKPDAGALIVSPADETPVLPHDAYAEDITLAEGIARYSEHVTDPVTRLLTSWAGLRTFAPDRELVIGPSAHDDTFIWCAGQGGYGMQTAPAASQLLADLVGGSTSQIAPEAVDRIAARRFH